MLRQNQTRYGKVLVSQGKVLYFLNDSFFRAVYRKRIREKQTAATETYSNDLHEALLMKNGTAFWRCWRSNVESKSKCSQVEGCIDPDVIADKFAGHFKASISSNDPDRSKSRIH